MTFSLLAALALQAAASQPLLGAPAPYPDGARSHRAPTHAVQSLKLGLKLQDSAGLDALIASQRDPASPHFRQWLTPQAFGERFGQPRADYEKLARALEAAGLKVTRYPNRLFLAAEGEVGQVERLLGTQLVDVVAGKAQFRSYQGAVRLPAELSALVQSVHGLDNRSWVRHRLTAGGQNTMGPQDLRRYYGIEDLHQAGYTGQLSRVVAIGDITDAANAPTHADVEWFYKNVSDASTEYVIDQLPLGSGQVDSQPGVKVELEMDSELPTVAAPGLQRVTLVQAPADSLFPASMNHIVNNLPETTAVTISFGTCEQIEQHFLPGEIPTVANLVAQGVVEGIAWFDASGDDGVVTCYQFGQAPYATQPAVDFPGAIPYMTTVGGTQYTGAFNGNGAIAAWGHETTWNEQGQAAGGGGVSILFEKPYWQVDVPGTTDGGFRELPDISLVASSQPGVAITSTRPGQIDPIGNGTSDASPLAAGMFALVNDFTGGCRLGSPNPELYALGQVQYRGGAAVFHDIQTGNISLHGVSGPAAHLGYDEATGLGSLDVSALAHAWPQCPTAPNPDGGLEIPPDAGAPWVPGLAVDGGTRLPYVPCDVIACDPDAGSTCNTVVQGPSACVLSCTGAVPGECGPGEHCDGAHCVAGCGADTDCGTGTVCQTCDQTCQPPGKAGAAIGDACQSGGDCQTGGQCLPDQYGFSNGYCAGDCSAGCGCPAGSLCGGGFCVKTCSVSTQQGCRSNEGYVCDPYDSTDVGTCLPDCRVTHFCFDQSATCNQRNGLCLRPGQTTSSTSTGSTASSSSSSGSSTSGTTGTSSGTSGTSGGAVSSSTGASGSSGATATSTATSSTGGASTGTTGSGSSTGGTTPAKKGCGCSAGEGIELAGLLAIAGARRRRRAAL
jgi:kumamolisin